MGRRPPTKIQVYGCLCTSGHEASAYLAELFGKSQMRRSTEGFGVREEAPERHVSGDRVVAGGSGAVFRGDRV